MTRDSLAKALYCRTVATIVRRANSLKRLGSTLGTLSSDSNESVHNQAEVTSQHASTIGSSAGMACISFDAHTYSVYSPIYVYFFLIIWNKRCKDFSSARLPGQTRLVLLSAYFKLLLYHTII